MAFAEPDSPSPLVVRRSLGPFLALGLLAVACATPSSSKPKVQTSSNLPEQRFTMSGAGFQTTALITKDGAQGPQIDIGRYEDGKAIRGKVDGRPLDLTVSDTEAKGIWSSGPISVFVEEGPEELKVTGLIAGRPSNVTVSRQKINGTIGFCSYELTNSGEAYLGQRSCGRGISNVTVQFPSSILEWKPINIAVLMALLMSTP